MFRQLFFDSFHFATLVFLALALLTSGWLHIDSWALDKKGKTHLFRGIGFFMLAIAYVIHATNFEIPIILFLVQIVKVIGSVLILLSLFKEPLLHPPSEKVSLFIPFTLAINFLVPSSVILYFLIALVYFWKSTGGHEKQKKSVAFAFFFLFLAELVKIPFYAADTNIVVLSSLLEQYGILWISYHILFLIGTIILSAWVIGYVRFRVNIQIFVITVTSIIGIFLITTLSFTYILLKNLENNALSHLKTDIKVMQYTTERFQLEALANAKAIANNTDVKNSLINFDKNKLKEATLKLAISQDVSFLLITDTNSKVLMRAEDSENTGDFLTEDPLLISALEGSSLTDITVKQGVVSPDILIRAAAPIMASQFTESAEIIGGVITGFKIDNAFVDGIKKLTGLDVVVFGGETRAATTFVSPDGKSRHIGTKEQNSEIINKVLKEGEIFVGPAKILNQSFYTAYSPLRKKDGDEVIGMLFVGKPQSELLETAAASTRLTFLGSAILMIFSIVPAYFISRRIHENLEA
ncbi:hypothetical protein E3I18_01795 [Candidatus Woesebacteria bacterium]|nr:MAG: hypothetical protein E3I18_01795 [Candidatus Woesebacteria bacterium]